MTDQDPHAARLQEARTLLARGERDQALAALYALVAVTPNSIEAWWLIARTTPHTTQKQEALQHVLRLDPNHAEARQMADRLSKFNAPTQRRITPPAAQPAPPQPQAPPPQSPQPQPYAAPPPQSYPPQPQQAYTAPPPPAPEPEPPAEVVREREIVYVEHVRSELQPFLVLNGGLTSGCFSLLLTIITMAVLSFMLIGSTIGEALQSVGALGAGEGPPLTLLPAIAVTAVLAFLRANPGALPIDPGGLLGPLFGVPAGSVPSGSELFESVLRSLWGSLGYPGTTGDMIMNRLSTIGPQISSSGWIALIIFLGGWVLLAFLFVFLRARSNRLLHWFLSTVGLWILTGLACGLGTFLYQIVFTAK